MMETISKFADNASGNKNIEGEKTVRLVGEHEADYPLDRATELAKLINKCPENLTVADLIYAQGVEIMIQQKRSQEEIDRKLVEFGYEPKNKINNS